MDIFKRDDISVLEYNKVLHSKYGDACLDWDPEVLYSRIDQDFHDWSVEKTRKAILSTHTTSLLYTDVCLVARNKIHALITVVKTDFPYKEWEVFEKVGEVFTDNLPSFSHITPLSPGQCAVALRLMHRLRPDDVQDDIWRYIAIQLHNDGFVLAPPSLKRAQPFIDALGNDMELKAQVATALETHKASDIKTLTFPDDDPVGVQIGKILSVEVYADERSRG